MKAAVLAAVALVGGAAFALAAPPRYDIARVCRQVGGNQGSVMASMSHQACMDAEQSARRDLTRRWTSIPEAIRKECEGTERALERTGSYVMLQSCIRANITAKEWRKANPARKDATSVGASAGGRGRTGSTGASGVSAGTIGNSARAGMPGSSGGSGAASIGTGGGSTASSGSTAGSPSTAESSRGISDRDSAWHDCVHDEDRDRSIQGCTTVLQRGARETAQNQAIALYNRGIGYMATGYTYRAISDYSEAIRLVPNEAATFINRGAAYHSMGDYDRAIADFDEAIRLDPKSAEAFTGRGAVHEKKGDLDRAISDYSQAIRLDPKDPNAFSNRCSAFYTKGDLDRALADCDQAIRLDPKHAYAYNNRGVIYSRKGDHARALADFEAALKIDRTLAVAIEGRNKASAALSAGRADPATSSTPQDQRAASPL